MKISLYHVNKSQISNIINIFKIDYKDKIIKIHTSLQCFILNDLLG
jgi:hypothetical protein